MQFEWDENKAHSNHIKHGVSFETAILAFDDPFSLRAKDVKHSSVAETRFWHIGESSVGVLVVVFTVRPDCDGERFRIISARRANKRERVLYEINKRVPV